MQFWPSFTAWTTGVTLAALVVIANYDPPPSHQPTPAAVTAVTDADINWYYETAFGKGFDANDHITTRPRVCPSRSQLKAAAQASVNRASSATTEGCSERLRARHRRAQQAIASFNEEYTRIQARFLKTATYQQARRDHRLCMSQAGINRADINTTPRTSNHWHHPSAAGTRLSSEPLSPADQQCAPILTAADDAVYRKTRAAFDAKHEVAARESLRYALAQPSTP